MTIEADTTFNETTFAKMSRMIIATDVETPAVNADMADMEREDLVAQILPEATTTTFKSKNRDSMVIKSRGLAKIEPPISSRENKLVVGSETAKNSLFCHQMLRP